MNWKIGDRCIVDCLGFKLHGETVEIVGGPAIGTGIFEATYDWIIDPGYPAPDCATKMFACDSVDLRPLPDEYDGKQVSTWDVMNDKDYIWHPEKVTVTI